MVEDGELIQQSRSGDLRAFEALYDRYKGQVYRAVLAITSDSVAAEDILQECFLRLHANIDRIDGSTPISPWLHRVAVNLAYNHMSRNKRRASPLSVVLETLVAGVVFACLAGAAVTLAAAAATAAGEPAGAGDPARPQLPVAPDHGPAAAARKPAGTRR